MLYLKSIFSPAIICAVFFSFYSCSSRNEKTSANVFSSDFVDIKTFKTVIKGSLPVCNTNDTTFNQQLLNDSDGLLNTAYAYALNNYEPLWMDASGIKPYVATLIDQLKSLNDDGIDTGKYHIAAICKAIEQLKVNKEIPLDSLVFWDKTFTHAWLQAAKELLLGTIEMKKYDSLWFAKNDASFTGSAILIKALQAKNTLPPLDTFRPEAKVYLQMKDALKHWKYLNYDSSYINAKLHVGKHTNDSVLIAVLKKELKDISLYDNNIKSWIASYQYYHQLATSSSLDSATIASLSKMPSDYIALLKMNMDRIRSLPKNIQGEYIWVTIPLMEVSYFKDEQLLFHERVVVGKVSRQTPSLWANMTNIVFNPPWGVPPTILKNDIGPGVSRSGSAYLGRKGLRAFDAKGNDVTASVNGSNYKRFSYKQPPGAGNSLGDVKFNLPNRWDIYLHDTPHRENFANRSRALSSGCVRVRNPRLLAEIILNDERYTSDKIDTIISTRKTKTEKLNRRLPVYIIYTTVAEDSTGNHLRYLKDVYKRDALVKKNY